MATQGGFINVHLFHELKQQYPEIPDGVVTDFMIQHSNNRSKCLEVLAVESPKHMFGEYTSASPVSHQLADLSLMEPARQRSDSGSSLKSNASTGSLPSQGHVASLAMAWPPPPQSSNGQASAASAYTEHGTPPSTCTAGVTDFGPYLTQGKSSDQIPNIRCKTKIPDSVSLPSTAVKSGTHHYSSPPQVRANVSARNPHSATSPNPNPSHIYNVSANLSHVNSNNVPVATGQYDMDSAVTTGAVAYSTGPSPQHLSEATIYIQSQRPNDNRFVNASAMPTVPVRPKLNIQQQNVHHQGSRIPVRIPVDHYVSNQDPQTSSAAASPMRDGNPPYVVRYAAVPGIPQQLHVSVSPTSSSPTTLDFSAASNPPSLVYMPSYNPPDMPVRGDIMPSANVATVKYPRQTKIDMPDYQTLTRNLQQAQSGSPVRDALTGSPVTQFPVSSGLYPMPLHSRITGGSPVATEVSQQQQQRRSSQQEEMEYIQALVGHQQLQKDKLASELERESTKLEQIRSQVSQLEKNVAETNDTFPTLEALVKLRESNRKLWTEIQCMTREIDMFNKGKTPLGITNPGQEAPFYSHLDQEPAGAAVGAVGPKPSSGGHGLHFPAPVRPPFNPVHPDHRRPQPPPRPPKHDSDVVLSADPKLQRKRGRVEDSGASRTDGPPSFTKHHKGNTSPSSSAPVN